MTNKPTETHTISEDDGWTLSGYLEANGPLHPELRFEYRPLTVMERSYIATKLSNISSARESTNLLAETLAARIKGWSAGAEITADTMRRLRGGMWDRLVMIVIYMTDGGDIDPDWAEDDDKLHADAELEASLSGTSVGDAKLEVLAKN